MLQNLTNFFSLITGGLIKTKPDQSDLIALGTRNPRFTGGYRPSAITYENLKADILNELPEESGCGVNFGLNWKSVGPKVSFKKTDYAIDFRDVIIPGELELTRADNQGLYNAVTEEGWNPDVSPQGTSWNSMYSDERSAYGWGNLANVADRSFSTFYNALDQNIGCHIVGMELVLRHNDSGRMWIIKFTEWTQGGNGGGFAYDRWEIFATTFFWRPSLEPNTVDQVSEGLIIKRDNVRGIYNAVLEKVYDRNCDNSPLGTEWNSVYTDSVNYDVTNLANVRNRKYGTWRDAVNANPQGAAESNLILVMHDLSTDLYWLVQFLYWGNGDSGPNGEFVYIRSLIPQDCGVEFNDGTVMTTVPTSSSYADGVSILGAGTKASPFRTAVPFIDNDGNTIIDDSSNNEISIPEGVDPNAWTHDIQYFSGMVMINDHYDGGVELWICGGGNANIISYTSNVGHGSMSINGNGYTWVNDEGFQGPFTFTVIKTRESS